MQLNNERYRSSKTLDNINFFPELKVDIQNSFESKFIVS